MKRLIGFVAILAVLGGAPVYADGAVAGGKLSIVEFSMAPENRGVPQRALEKRYADYRAGRFALTTLDTQHVR